MVSVTGTTGDDSIDSGAGDDVIDGLAGDDTIFAGDGADTIEINDGFGNDTIYGGSGGADSDTIDGSGLTSGVDILFTANEGGNLTDGTHTLLFSDIEAFFLTGHDDTFVASGTNTSATVSSGAGDDSIIAGNAADSIDAGSGDDTVDAGTGDDTINMGDGSDTVILSDNFGNDTITGGEGGADADTIDAMSLTAALNIILTGDESGTATSGTNTATFSEIEQFILTNNDDTFDASGTTTQGTTVDAAAGEDSIIGSDFADSIFGGDDNDTIDGGEGSDTIDGGDGDDTIDAGDDADTIVITDNYGNDTVTGGSGTTTGGVDNDTLDASSLSDAVDVFVSGPESGILSDLVSGLESVSFSDIETFVLTDGDDSFTGFGNIADSTVYGGGGVDAIIGGAGVDTFYGGTGDDIVDGFAGDDVLYGGDGADFVHGFGDNDSLFGGADADTFALEDGSGTDTMYGGGTTTTGGLDNDTIDASALTNAINLTFSGDEAGTLTTGIETATFDDMETFILSDQADTVDGSASTASMTILAGAGDDSIIGGSGADFIDTGTGADTINAGAGDDIIFAGDDADIILLTDGFGSDTVDAGSGGTDNDTLDASSLTSALSIILSGDETGTVTSGVDTVSFSDVENFILTSSDDTFDGSSATTKGATINAGAGADSIIGTGGDDTIKGKQGSDTIDGGAGDDSILAGHDADTIILSDGFGADTISGGENTTSGGVDNDTIDASALTSGVDVILSGNEGGTLTDGTDTATFDTVENFILTSSDDTFDGSSATTKGATINAGAGADSIIGTGGDDTIKGKQGSDTIDGGAGDDSIIAGHDADTLILSDGFGADTISGGENTTSGGVDNDTIDASTLTAALNVILTGNEAGSATDGTDTATFTQIESFTLTGNDDTFDGSLATGKGATVDAGAGDDSIIGTQTDDSIIGGAGADTINAGDGDDTIDAGDDADTIILSDGFGSDTITGGEGTTSGGSDDDTIDASTLTSGVDVTLSADETGSLTDGTDTLTFAGIENFLLTSGDDTFDGSAATTDGATVYGGDGIDSFIGGGGDDVFFGGSGLDTFLVNTGDDASGGDGDDFFQIDVLAGGPQDITITGGEGDETLGDTLNLGGQVDDFATDVVYSGGDNESGTITLNDGSIITFSEIENIVVCFTPGTFITTPRGPVLVENLRVDDLVITADNGLQAIRWIGRKHISGARLYAYPNLRPIKIRKDAFGPNVPYRDMHVSPQHRMLIDSSRALINHGDHEVLAPAKGLLNDMSVTVDYEVKDIDYIHILFDRHEIVLANGAATESFHPGHMSLSSIDEAPRDEIFNIFPELRALPNSYGPTARTCLKGFEGRLLGL